MILAVGLENELEGRALAWALDFPGCFAAGADAAGALMRLPQAFIKYQDWIASHTRDSWVAGVGDFDVRLVETFDRYRVEGATLRDVSSGGIEINAWFRHDGQPLSMQEARRGMLLLSWSRADLLAALAEAPPDRMDVLYPGQRWSMREVLGHIAGAEWEYLDRLGLTAGKLERAALPPDPLERLAAVRAVLEAALPALAGSPQVVGADGELWSPRKLLRRALWHELDHIGHIYQLILLGS